MLLLIDPLGAFYATTTQATSGIYSTLAGNFLSSGLPAGMVSPTCIQNCSSLIYQVPNTNGPYFFGVRWAIETTIGSAENIFAFLDGSGQPQVTFQTNTNGTIMAKRGTGNGTLLGTSSTAVVLTQGTAQYVEFGMYCNNGAGWIVVNINGTQVLSLTAQNTQGQGSAIIGAVNWLGANLASNGYIQDLYVCDSTGSYNNTFRGEITVGVLHAAGAGTPAINQYTANGAATVWQATAATTPADSTIYASDFTPGDRMSVTPQPTAALSIGGIAHVSRIQKTETGSRTCSQAITSNGVDAIAAAVSPGTAYAYFMQISESDPSTGAPYTPAGVNALQFGLETVS
jgi:hypothetical protein